MNGLQHTSVRWLSGGDSIKRSRKWRIVSGDDWATISTISSGQHLTGTALAAQVLKEKLAARSCPETSDAEKLVRCLEEGIDFTRNLARGFFSPELRAEGLVVALQNLAETVSEQSDIDCILHGGELIPLHDSTVANQLYRIAQEAVTNSVKHAAANHIHIRLAMDGPELCLSIVDDGVGFPDKPGSGDSGFISCVMRRRSAVGRSIFAEMGERNDRDVPGDEL